MLRTMLTMLATVLVLVGFVLVLLGALGILIAAFQESVLWGLGVLFIGGICTPLFIILHWGRAKGSVFLWLYGVGAILLAVLLADNNLPWPLH